MPVVELSEGVAPDATGYARARFVITLWNVESAAALHCRVALVGSPIGTTSTRRAFVFWSTATLLVAFASLPVVV